MFLGATIPSDSFVDFDDIMNIGSGCANIPSNTNPSDNALVCVTDLEDCCNAPHTVHQVTGTFLMELDYWILVMIHLLNGFK